MRDRYWLPSRLIVINIRQLYVRGELAGPESQGSEKLAALQFAAQLHELLMLASFGAIVSTAVREELALCDGLPFGAALAGLQLDSTRVLWSIESLSVVYTGWLHSSSARRRRCFLVTLLAICAILGISVRPSTSNLMRQRLRQWPAGGTTYWLDAPPDVLFASELTPTPDLEQCSGSFVDNMPICRLRHHCQRV